jgi:hypothetical protein
MHNPVSNGGVVLLWQRRCVPHRIVPELVFCLESVRYAMVFVPFRG